MTLTQQSSGQFGGDRCMSKLIVLLAVGLMGLVLFVGMRHGAFGGRTTTVEAEGPLPSQKAHRTAAKGLKGLRRGW
jgi:hypothetical protein